MVETLIFMAVSSAVFVSSMAVVRDHQSRTDFQYGFQELASELRGIINDVSTGYYENNGSYSCDGSSGTPVISTTAGPQGSNNTCIYVGRVVHFTPDSTTSGIDQDQVYRVYTAVGVRALDPPGDQKLRDVETIEEASPVLIPETFQNASIEKVIPNGIKLRTARRVGGGGPPSFAFGLFTNFARYSELTKKSFETDSRSVAFVPLTANTFRSQSQINNQVRTLRTADLNDNPGTELCFEGRGYRGLLIVGGNNSNLNDDLRIERGDC